MSPVYITTTLSLILNLALYHPVTGLKCFLCSEFDKFTCPNNATSVSTWASQDANYQSIGAAAENSCSVGADDTGKIFIQSGVPITMCTSSDYQNSINARIVRAGGSNPTVTCCSNDACNWNATSAQKNQNYGDLTGSLFYIPDIVNWTPIVIGVIVAVIVFFCLIALCIYFCCCRRGKRGGPPPRPVQKQPPPRPSPRHLAASVGGGGIGDPRNAPPTPTRLIGVQPKPTHRDRDRDREPTHQDRDREKLKPIKKPEPKDEKKVAPDPLKKGTVDPLITTKDLFAKEQSEWNDIWRKANDPHYHGPLKEKKKATK